MYVPMHECVPVYGTHAHLCLWRASELATTRLQAEEQAAATAALQQQNEALQQQNETLEQHKGDLTRRLSEEVMAKQELTASRALLQQRVTELDAQVLVLQQQTERAAAEARARAEEAAASGEEEMSRLGGANDVLMQRLDEAEVRERAEVARVEELTTRCAELSARAEELGRELEDKEAQLHLATVQHREVAAEAEAEAEAEVQARWEEQLGREVRAKEDAVRERERVQAEEAMAGLQVSCLCVVCVLVGWGEAGCGWAWAQGVGGSRFSIICCEMTLGLRV